MALIELVKYVLSFHKLEYVLPGCFQTDELEARFGAYRRLSGCNYNVSVAEILQSEKKLRVSSLLRVHSESHGNVGIKEFLSEFEPVSEIGGTEVVEEFLAEVLASTDTLEDVPDDEEAAIVYAAGYVAKKGCEVLSCVECKNSLRCADESALQVEFEESALLFFAHTDRGGLTYPTDRLVTSICISYSLFSHILRKGYEQTFMRLDNPKAAFLKLIERYLEMDGGIDLSNSPVCQTCHTSSLDIFRRAHSTFSNILLNNYSKAVTDSQEKKKADCRKHKKFS